MNIDDAEHEMIRMRTPMPYPLRKQKPKADLFSLTETDSAWNASPRITPMNTDTPETNSHLGALANAPDSTCMWLKIGPPRKFERQRNELAGYLCRVKLPLPLQLAARLAKLFPGENVRMREEAGYLCIFETETNNMNHE